jgi:hypothetical protein
MILLSVSQRTYFNLLIAFLLKEKRLFPFRNPDYMHNQKVNT